MLGSNLTIRLMWGPLGAPAVAADTTRVSLGFLSRGNFLMICSRSHVHSFHFSLGARLHEWDRVLPSQFLDGKIPKTTYPWRTVDNNINVGGMGRWSLVCPNYLVREMCHISPS